MCIKKCIKCGKNFNGTPQATHCDECWRKCDICGGRVLSKKHSKCKIHKNTQRCIKCGEVFETTTKRRTCNSCMPTCEICGRLARNNSVHRCEKCIGLVKCNLCGKVYKGASGIKIYCSDCRNECIICGAPTNKKDSNKCKSHEGVAKCERCGCLFKGIKGVCFNCKPKCLLCGKKCGRKRDIYCSKACMDKSSLVVKHREETMLKKYAVKNAMLSDTLKQKAIDTCVKNNGVERFCMHNKCIESSGKAISEVNKWWGRKLGAVDFEFVINNYRYDLKIGDTLIEINPSRTHNLYKTPYGDIKPATYHKSKTQTAEENGYKCFHIFDWDDKNKVIDFLTRKIEKKYYARNLIIKEVPYEEGKELINKYHFQGDYRIRNGRIGLGLYDGDELIMITTRGKPRMNKGGEGVYELWRLCTKGGAIVVGGFERLFKHFIKMYNPTKIISYCDRAKFSGEAYRKVGMIEIANKPSIHYYHPRLNKHITGFGLRTLGFDNVYGGMPAPQKCVFTKDIFRKGSIPENREDIVINKGDPIPFFNKIVGDKTTNNIKLLLAIGFLPVPDCGQSTFVRENTKKV